MSFVASGDASVSVEESVLTSSGMIVSSSSMGGPSMSMTSIGGDLVRSIGS